MVSVTKTSSRRLSMRPLTPTARTARSGLALIELLAALALAALLLRLALPAYENWIASLQVMQEAQHLAASMNWARAEAIKRGVRVNICKSSTGSQCTPGSLWHGGWIMHVDADASGQLESASDLIRAREPLAPGVTVSANRPVADYVSYTSYGHARMLSGALQIGTLTVCVRGQAAMNVVLSAGGRARIAKSGAICP
jgi:type IV fimbrial biogenesis protein FimT